jgi:hypothetical protein
MDLEERLIEDVAILGLTILIGGDLVTYRIPSQAVVKGWAAKTPPDFAFARQGLCNKQGLSRKRRLRNALFL